MTPSKKNIYILIFFLLQTTILPSSSLQDFQLYCHQMKTAQFIKLQQQKKLMNSQHYLHLILEFFSPASIKPKWNRVLQLIGITNLWTKLLSHQGLGLKHDELLLALVIYKVSDIHSNTTSAQLCLEAAAGESEEDPAWVWLIVSLTTLSGGGAAVERGSLHADGLLAGPYMKYLVKPSWSIQSTVFVCPH